MFKFDLLENEKVLALYRQSESVLFKPALWVLALIYFPWFFLLKYELASAYDRLLLFWTILVLLYAVNKYLLWLLNLYIVTDRRLVSVGYKNLLNKKVLESPLEKILNVSFYQKGFWQALFSQGTVEVQIAGLNEPMVLKNLSQPSKIKDFLWRIHSSHRQLRPANIRREPGAEVTPRPPEQPARPRRMDL